MNDDVLTERLSAVQKDNQNQIQGDLEVVLATPAGRRFMMWLLSNCHLYDACFRDEDRFTSFTLGERNIGLRVLSVMNDISPTTYPRFLLNHAADPTNKENEIAFADDEDPEFNDDA